MKLISLLELEGLILNGFIKHLKIVDCEHSDKLRLSKLIGMLSDDTEIATECYEYVRLSRIYEVFTNYVKFRKLHEVSSYRSEM